MCEDKERQLQHVTRALRTLSAGNNALLRASNEHDLLDAMCSVIIEKGIYASSGVMYARHDEGKTLELMAIAFSPEIGPEAQAFFRNLQISWADTDLGQHVPGIAVRTGEACIGRNLLTDPGHAPWREEATRCGYASVSAFPLRIEGEVIGVLGIAAAEPDAFDVGEAELLAELAGNLAYGIANIRGQIKRRDAEAAVRHMAYYDLLTGLANRSKLCEQIQTMIAAAGEQMRSFALLLFSVADLQDINDTLGYEQGDRLLQAIAQRMKPAGNDGQFARVSEAEFALLLPYADAEGAAQSADRLISLLAAPVNVSGLDIDVRMHVGIALFPDHGSDAELLLRRARVAMFEAKRARQAHRLFLARLDQESNRRFDLMSTLRRAIGNNQLQLYYQPKMHLSSGRVCGAEALVRWKHPQQGFIPPSEFVQLAEHAGLITQLSSWVLEAAFQQAHAWCRLGFDQLLSINLSAYDLRNPHLFDKLNGLFATWGVAPASIQFELTESAFMEDSAAAIETLTRIKMLGVGLAIDDFGTGYSSLSYLYQLPVDVIKLDQSFMLTLMQRHDVTAIVRSTIELGHSLGLEVLAEGVESKAIWDMLTELGCDVAQGFYVGMPMPADQFQSWVRTATSRKGHESPA